MQNTQSIQMRDPYVLVHNGKYYLYGTTDKNCWRGIPEGFDAYESADLENWEGPHKIFAPSDTFWGKENFWAPELHVYKNEFYLFATFKAPGKCRATSILKSASPLGPFKPWGAEFVTPEGDECLDGTLYVDGSGKPWIVYCHEWVQEGGGTVCARRLKEDLSAGIGESTTLFSAKDAKWTKEVTHSSGIKGNVTDGPNVYRAKNGELWILWSSLSETGYSLGITKSADGNLLGEWEHSEKALFSADGGHGMIFADLTGTLNLTLHSPNDTPNERPVFMPIIETDDGFEFI